MKKLLIILIVVSVLLMIATCNRNLTDKSDIISLFQKNKAVFLQAVSSGDYSGLERINGVQTVYCTATYIDIKCGGAGFGPSTHYYGIFYSADDNLCAVDVAGPRDQLVEHGSGYLYQEPGGDNRYYVEPLGDHFYYYEAHF